MIKTILFTFSTCVALVIATKATSPVPPPLLMGNDNQENISDVTIMNIMNECNETFRIQISYLTSLAESGSFPDETDKTPKCYIRCVLMKLDVFSDNGDIDQAQATLIFAGAREGKQIANIEDMIASCSERKESCKCEKAYMFMRCIKETQIEKYGSH